MYTNSVQCKIFQLSEGVVPWASFMLKKRLNQG